MTLPSSGQITLNQIHVEAGGSSGSQVALSDTDVKGLIGADNIDTKFSHYHGAAASSISHCSRIGGGSTTTNQFPNCNASVAPSGTKILVVVVMMRVQSGTGISNGPASVTIGGQSCSLRVISNANVTASGYGHINSIWTLNTSTLGNTQFVTGSGMSGTGNNSCHVYQLLQTSAPSSIATASATNYTSLNPGGSPSTSDTLTLSGVNGGAVIFGCTATSSSNSGSISVSPSATVVQNSFSNLNHSAAHKFPSSAGSTTYTFTNNQSGYFNIVGAAFQ